MGEVYDVICPECGSIYDNVFKNKEIGSILSCSFCSKLKHYNINICDICTNFDELTCTCFKKHNKKYINACEEFLLYDAQEEEIL